eukprot:comp21639_c0_seq1/m.30402 comp21639_c0_seq1/g.30402  ORF comp21639_c0_seq1/g.30402 comp21639_c0_seq1/m.30402 type:complete len:303 (-) comp21639_c0_seq1:642-1550(-)
MQIQPHRFTEYEMVGRHLSSSAPSLITLNGCSVDIRDPLFQFMNPDSLEAISSEAFFSEDENHASLFDDMASDDGTVTATSIDDFGNETTQTDFSSCTTPSPLSLGTGSHASPTPRFDLPIKSELYSPSGTQPYYYDPWGPLTPDSGILGLQRPPPPVPGMPFFSQQQQQAQKAGGRRKRRDAAALARCREHSARSRERRKQERRSLEQYATTKAEEAAVLKEKVDRMEQEAQELKNKLFQNAMSLQQQALGNPALLSAALTAMAQVHAMSNFQAAPVQPKRESNRPPLCPKPASKEPLKSA